MSPSRDFDGDARRRRALAGSGQRLQRGPMAGGPPRSRRGVVAVAHVLPCSHAGLPRVRLCGGSSASPLEGCSRARRRAAVARSLARRHAAVAPLRSFVSNHVALSLRTTTLPFAGGITFVPFLINPSQRGSNLLQRGSKGLANILPQVLRYRCRGSLMLAGALSSQSWSGATCSFFVLCWGCRTDPCGALACSRSLVMYP